MQVSWGGGRGGWGPIPLIPFIECVPGAPPVVPCDRLTPSRGGRRVLGGGKCQLQRAGPARPRGSRKDTAISRIRFSPPSLLGLGRPLAGGGAGLWAGEELGRERGRGGLEG